MPELPAFSAIIFDMDGLVLETEKTYASAWQHAIIDMGYPCETPFCQSLSGLASTQVTQKLYATYGSRFNLELFSLKSTQHWQQHVATEGIAIKLGFQQLLDVITAKKIPYALATNSPHKNALDCLALAGLKDVFPIIVSGDQVKNPKPDPEIFSHTAQRLNTPIKDCLILEDSPSGILAAQRSGAMVIYIPSNDAIPELSALSLLTLEHLGQLSECITNT